MTIRDLKGKAKHEKPDQSHSGDGESNLLNTDGFALIPFTFYTGRVAVDSVASFDLQCSAATDSWSPSFETIYKTRG